MKFFRFFPVVITVLTIGACSVSEQENPFSFPSQQGTELTFTAEFDEPQTKTEMHDQSTIWWSEGDEICIFFGESPEGNRFVSQETESTQKARFTGSISAFTGETETGETNYFWAVYPYDAAISFDGASVVAKLDNEQVAKAGSFATNTNVTIAKSPGLSLSFKNICSQFRFTVTRDDIKSVTFRGNNDEDLAGTFRISMDESGIPTTLVVVEGQKEITLTAPDGEYFEVGPWYFIELLPQTLESGFTMTLETETSIGSRSIERELAFERSSYNWGQDFDANVEFIPNQTIPAINYYVKVNSAEELVVGGKYLIVYESDSKAFLPILNSSKNGLVTSGDNVFLVSIDNGLIQSTDDVDACQIEIESASSGYYLKAVAAEGYYFYPTSNGVSASNTASTSNAISVDDSGNVTITASKYYFKYSTSSNYFKQSSYSGVVALYILDEGGQHLKFSSNSVSYVLDGQAVPLTLDNAPMLSGACTRVTYTSSNPSVATVGQFTGEVTVQGPGKAIITATAEATSSYNEATASYTLTVWSEATFSVENDMLAAYLDAVEDKPYDPENYSTTHMTSSIYGGTSETNRLDWPKPVPISWTNPTSGNDVKVVYVYNDEAKTSLETSVEVSSTVSMTADIYNLIPNRTYYYTVTNGDTELKTGKFSTIGRRRMIKVGDSPYGKKYANNCRDFGGQITESGRMIKYGKMYRGSNMDGTASSGQSTYILGYMGVGLDVDLRTSGSNPGGGENVLYDALGLNDWHTTQTFNSWSDLSSQSKMKAVLTKVFDAVANDKVVYIHCMVGADRTGYVCMLLEALLGLSQGSCDVDYELTSFSAAVGTRTRTGTGNYYYRTKNGTIQGVDFINTFDGKTFQEKAIDYVTRTDSKGLGISLETVQVFQNKMLE